MGEGDSTVSVFDSAPAGARRRARGDAGAGGRAPGRATSRIAVRFGLHTGEAERRGTDYFGPTLNLAARLRGQADGGQIFLSSVTADLVAARLPDGCELVDLGPHRLQGRRRRRSGSTRSAAPGVDAPPPVTDCPYRGLLAFEAEDRDVLLRARGRGRAICSSASRPAGSWPLVGASGSGKSSVLRAGVVAAVEAGEVEGIDRVRLLTPGADPQLDVAGDAGELRDRRPVRGAVHAVRRRRARGARSSTRCSPPAAPS